MRHFALFAAALVLVLPTGCSWSLVYPYQDPSTLLLALLLAGMCLFVLATVFGNWSVRVWAAAFAAASVSAGVVTIAWSALSWQTGLWYPEFPQVLHKVFSTDGEASYNASDGQLFILLFVAFMAGATALKSRVFAAIQFRARAERNDG